MKKVQYMGELEKILPTLGLTVNKGDVVEVPDDFFNAEFQEVKEKVAPQEAVK